ncbi:MAG: MBL fold metallo-hydrolase [Acidobacteria bacterium]|nr:MBL fold metallo-hydrolase [Acidobacteriota bacterium]
MILNQYYLGCLAQASYLIADEMTGDAVVVDPRRDIGQYLDDAGKLGLHIRYAILTHFHADFVAGHIELKEAVGARIGLGRLAQADYEFVPLADGQTIDLGSVRLRVLETPGHTPESISILVYDLGRSRSVPHAVLTGDTLFIGDVGRPDLMAAAGVSATDLAGALYDSLHRKLLTLPDETLVYPAHGAGSMCGKNLGKETVSTMGAQRRFNYALQPLRRDEFVRLVTADQPDAPQYFAHDAELNRRKRPTLGAVLDRTLRPLALGDLLRLKDTGGQLLDVREAVEFEGAHMTGAVNVGLHGTFASWCGTVLDHERPIAIIAAPERQQEAALRLGRIGLDQVAGYLDGGMQALESRPDLVRHTERVTAVELSDELASGTRPFILDVRTAGEYEEKRIERGVNIPLNHLAEHVDRLPSNQRIVVHCAAGYRSAIAVSMLECRGFERLADLIGGMAAWESAKLPTAVRS